MDKGIVCLTFDDARADNVSVFRNILFPAGIPATLFVTTGYVDRTCPEKFRPSKRSAMSKQDVVSLSSSPLVEIAAHGDRHLNTDEDIDCCHQKLTGWLGLAQTDILGFSSPSSRFSLEQAEDIPHWLVEHSLAYIATSHRFGAWKNLQLFCRKAGRVLHFPFLYEIAYKDTLMDRCENGIIYRVPVLRDTTNKQINRIVRRCMKENKALFLMFHSVDSVAEDNWVWKEAKFRVLCQYLAELRDAGEIDLCTVRNACTFL